MNVQPGGSGQANALSCLGNIDHLKRVQFSSYGTLQELEQASKAAARLDGFQLLQHGGHRQKHPRFVCNRAGSHKPNPSRNYKNYEKTGCIFSVTLNKSPVDQQWRIRVRNSHNHPLIPAPRVVDQDSALENKTTRVESPHQLQEPSSTLPARNAAESYHFKRKASVLEESDEEDEVVRAALLHEDEVKLFHRGSPDHVEDALQENIETDTQDHLDEQLSEERQNEDLSIDDSDVTLVEQDASSNKKENSEELDKVMTRTEPERSASISQSKFELEQVLVDLILSKKKMEENQASLASTSAKVSHACELHRLGFNHQQIMELLK